MKEGTVVYTVVLEALYITDKDDGDAKNLAEAQKKEEERLKTELKEEKSKLKTYAGYGGIVIGCAVGLALP